MKQKFVNLAKKVIDEKTNFNERVIFEDQLIEMAYQIAQEYELKPDEFDKLMSDKRSINGMLKPVGDMKQWFKNALEEKSKAKESIEKIGDILEIVETYTARF